MPKSRLLAVLVVPCLLLLYPASAGAAPSCAEGPQTVGTTIVGTPCADTIRMPRSVTTVYGEGGDDVLYGQRGNDSIYGGEGNDRLYGGVGDDRLRGGPGNDRLSGGFGADSLDGEGGDDFDRGDATIDSIGDSGGGSDTISFATGVTPGFPNTGSFFTSAGFPPGAEGRGVYIDMSQDFANDGAAPSGGGFDVPLGPATDFSAFETVIGTPFPDYIVGTSGAETFYGGGGADLIDGGGGGDVAHGGVDGDGCVDVTTSDCEFSSEKIQLRDPGTIAVGVMAPGGPGGPAVYLTGSDEDDRVTASYASGAVTFTLLAGSKGQFDSAEAVAGGCSAPSGGSVSCPVAETPDSILLSGLGGDDVLSAPSLPEAVSLVILGNEDDDSLTGGETEDALIDGAGADTVNAAGRDDALPNNGGADQLHAGAGEDLFISNAVCDGDLLDGGADRDNANWANFESAVTIDMAQHVAGLIGPQGEAHCDNADELTSLEAIEDIEATNGGDNLIGDAGPNQLLGRDGPDNFFGGAGDDLLLANSEDFEPINSDADPIVDCGEGFDTALIDFAPVIDGPPVNCESVEERAPNSFRPPDTPADPQPEPEVEPPPPPPKRARPQPQPDRTPPATRLRHHPAALLFAAAPRRRVSFAFAASEPNAGFRCRLDRQAWRPCRSPRAYLVRPGRHVFRAFAIDAAGNRDRSPLAFKFSVRRRD
ncbi:MAG TPA: calcium-binding protein [Solirubrobacterales bacterium]|nr:calcium-binding protein [Solirubrobacterales bacterium]